MNEKPPPIGALRWAKRIIVAIVGATVLLAGAAMLLLPGPGWLTIFLGLGILGLEFAFARRWLAHLRARGRDAYDRVRGRPRTPQPPDS